MKKTYKRILAIALCLALAAAIIPSTVFAENTIPVSEEHKTGDVIPGEVNVLLKEPYYVYGGPYPDLRDILPEIEIESYKDLCLSVLTVHEKPIEEHAL